MKKQYLILAILALVSLVAIMTNPNQERHKEVIKNQLNAYIQKSMNESQSKTDNELKQAGQVFDLMLVGVLVDKILDNLVSTDNYVLFSTTKLSWEGKTKIIGIGAFGNVFITSKFDEAMNEGLLKNQ